MNSNNIKVEITDIASTGSGVGKYEGIAVFVDGAITGDIVEVKITQKKKNYISGEIVRIIKPSENRITPACKVYEKCGGCQIMAMEYNAQLKYKENMLFETLKRIGKIENPVISPIISMQEPYFYRNKIQIPIGEKNSKIEMGFFARGSHNLVEFEKCYIQPEICQKIMDLVREYLETEKIPVYNEELHSGNIRHLVIRKSYHMDELMVILVTRENSPLKNIDKLIHSLKSQIPEFTSLVQNTNPQKTNVILGKDNITLFGNAYITDIIEDLEFKIGPSTFFQTNNIQMENLYNKAFEYAEITKDDVIYDLYCGIGTISLLAAKRAKKVYGVEISKNSIENAKENAEKNKIDNAEFIAGKAEEVIKSLAKTADKPDIIILDPARSGAHENVLKTLLELAPKKIVYISCNPSTLARDLNILLAPEEFFECDEEKTYSQYNIEKIIPVDMFPHSTHVETIVLLSKTKV